MAETLTDKRRTRWAATPTKTTVEAQRAFYSLTVPSPNNYKTITDLEIAWYKVTLGIQNPPGVLKPSLADWRYYYFGTLTPTGKTVSDREYGATGGGVNPEPPPLDPLTFVAWERAFWASDPAWVPSANGSPAPSWRDGSGNGKTATQAVGANQPIYNATGLAGKPCLVFDGTNDFFDSVAASLKPCTIFMVIEADNTTPSNKGTVLGSSAGGGSNLCLRYSGNKFQTLKQMILVMGTSVTTVPVDNVPESLAFTYSGIGDANYWRNGYNDGSFSVDHAIASQVVSIGTGAGEYFQGKVGFMGIALSVLTDSQIIQLAQWAKSFYSTPAPPTTFDPMTSLNWIDVVWADDPGWTNPGNGNPVDSWRNGGSNGTPATSAGTTRPLFKTGQINGKSVLEFDGVDDFIRAASVNLAAPFAEIIVSKSLNNTQGGNDYMVDGNGNGGLLAGRSATTFRYFCGSDQTTLAIASVLDPVMITAEFGPTTRLQINNVSKVNGNGGGANMGGFSLGNGYAGGVAGNYQIAYYARLNRWFTTSELAALWAWAQPYYALV